MKVNFTQANLSAFKIGSKLFFFDIKKVTAHISQTNSKIEWWVGLPVFQHSYHEDVRYSLFGETYLKNITLKNNIAFGHFYIQGKHQFEVYVSKLYTEVTLDLSKTNNAYTLSLNNELVRPIKSSINIDNLPKDFTVYDLDAITQDIFKFVQSELLKEPLTKPLKINPDIRYQYFQYQYLNVFHLDGNFLFSSNYAVCAELHKNGGDVNVKFSFCNFIDNLSKINASDKYCFGEVNLPNVKIKLEAAHSVSDFTVNAIITERVSDEYAFLGAFNKDLIKYYKMPIHKDIAQRLNFITGKKFVYEYSVIDLNRFISDILYVIQKYAVEPF